MVQSALAVLSGLELLLVRESARVGLSGDAKQQRTRDVVCEEGSLESDGGIYHRDVYASVSVAGAISYVAKHVYSPTQCVPVLCDQRTAWHCNCISRGLVVIIPHIVHCIIFSYPSRILFTRNARVACVAYKFENMCSMATGTIADASVLPTT
ncbi:hypothetical protein BKA82DRAFT_2551119 [Pisolithus tinctorius]|nr:hypothetical protein BKA82DRAFT_2551119 [Pisolithus tinctorius]